MKKGSKGKVLEFVPEPANPLAVEVAAKVALAQSRGTTVCAVSITEFECLEEKHRVTSEDRPILCELGVLGYAAGITLFDSEIWSDGPLRFRGLA